MTRVTLTRDQLVALEPCDLDSRLALFGRRKSMTAVQALREAKSPLHAEAETAGGER